MAANLADLLSGINREHHSRKLAVSCGNSAAVRLFCGKIPLLGRFNSAAPRHSEIYKQTID
jgi:hypothetical protein